MKKTSTASWPVPAPKPVRLIQKYAEMSNRRIFKITMHPEVDHPDEKKVRELNDLAAKAPFCVHYKAKKHDTL